MRSIDLNSIPNYSRSDPKSLFYCQSEAKEIRQEYIRSPLQHKNIKLIGQNITAGITWNTTELPNAHLILRTVGNK